MTTIVSARLRVLPGSASAPMISVLCGVPSMPPPAGSSEARAPLVTRPFASLTAK